MTQTLPGANDAGPDKQAEPAAATRPPAGGGKRLKQAAVMHKQLSRIGWIYTSPALVVIALVTIFPILFSVVLSFNNVQVSGGEIQMGSFTTQNYTTMFGAQEWQSALVFTIVYTLITVVIEIILGTLAALVLERLGAGRGWMMALLLIPWSMITVISAQLWKYIYDPTYGAVTWFTGLFTDHPPVLMNSQVSATGAMMVADIWKTTPFVAIIVLAGLVMIPGDVYEAAEIDGAGAWTTFWKVVLPQLRPTIAIAVLFRILQAFGLFDLPYVLTQGASGTKSLAFIGFETLFQKLHFGTAAAIATSTAALVLLVCLIFLRAFRSQVGEEDAA
jgi:multiple sugar transport system permease protein